MRMWVLKFLLIGLAFSSVFSQAAVLRETKGRERSFQLGAAACSYKGENLQIEAGNRTDKQGGYLKIILNNVKSKLQKSTEEVVTLSVKESKAGEVFFSTFSGDDLRKYVTPKFLVRPPHKSECSLSITRGKGANPDLALSLNCVSLTLADLDPTESIQEKFMETASFEVVAGDKKNGHLTCNAPAES